MSRLVTLSVGLAAFLVLSLGPSFSRKSPILGPSEHGFGPEQTAPAYDPPTIVVAAGIDSDDNLLLVNFRTTYIGFSGESYNNRSLSKSTLKGIDILTVKGDRVSVDVARDQLAGKDTPILCSSWSTPLPDFYASLFSPTTLHFIFPEESPEWKKIQEPGRPIRLP